MCGPNHIADEEESATDRRHMLKVQIKAAKESVKYQKKELRDYERVVTKLQKELAKV